MTLSAERARALRAIVDRIVPADDAPSASEAGVLDYFARKLAAELAGFADRFAEGLDAVDAEATARFGHAFADLRPAEQDDVLRFVEAGRTLVDWPGDPVRFFVVLVESTVEGYYGDPGNGGNRDAASWKMCGFEERLRV